MRLNIASRLNLYSNNEDYIKRIAIYLFALFATLPLNALEQQKDRVQVDFSNPSRFLDTELDGMDDEMARQIVLDKVRDVFVSEGQKCLPNEYSIKIQVLDIDLAGGYKPWRLWEDPVRIYQENYPPRIEFEYEILNESGQVVISGEEYLYNLVYLFDFKREEYRSKEVAYEVSMLIEDWMKEALPRIMKGYVS